MSIRDLLVGVTGFVGGNLAKSHFFQATCHSTDVHTYYGTEPELCVYAGVPSTMYLANANPDGDLDIIKQALTNIRMIKPKKLVLISTVAVYSKTKDVDESIGLELSGVSAYGRNRALLEEWVRIEFPSTTIIRLPALYGEGIKKNFLYDIHMIVPSMLKHEKFEELCNKNECIQNSYILADNGFYKLSDSADLDSMRHFFEKNDFNALSFTDSRSRYQFYNLGRLWVDICRILDNKIELINLVTPPVSAGMIYEYVIGNKGWENRLESFFDYDIKTKYSEVFGHNDGYICRINDEIKDIVQFMKLWKKKDL